MKSNNYYKISELSHISSTPVSTIRYYIKEGLLPAPIKTGKTVAYYTDDHLSRLQLIKKLQSENQRSLASMKKELEKIPLTSTAGNDSITGSSEKRNAIVTAAIDLFIDKGLGNTSIDDIVNKASIGKGTFYKYFKNKDDLFFQCADSIFYEMYRHVWQEIKDERDMTTRLFRRSIAFFDSYPRWIDMMNLIRHASVGSNSFYKEKFKSILEQIINPIAHDLKILQNEGKIDKNLDYLGLAYVLMGMTEYCAWLSCNSKYTIEEIYMTLLDLITNGMGKKNK